MNTHARVEAGVVGLREGNHDVALLLHRPKHRNPVFQQQRRAHRCHQVVEKILPGA